MTTEWCFTCGMRHHVLAHPAPPPSLASRLAARIRTILTRKKDR